jgi:hypothetical protein
LLLVCNAKKAESMFLRDHGPALDKAAVIWTVYAGVETVAAHSPRTRKQCMLREG